MLCAKLVAVRRLGLAARAATSRARAVDHAGESVAETETPSLGALGAKRRDQGAAVGGAPLAHDVNHSRRPVLDAETRIGTLHAERRGREAARVETQLPLEVDHALHHVLAAELLERGTFPPK